MNFHCCKRPGAQLHSDDNVELRILHAITFAAKREGEFREQSTERAGLHTITEGRSEILPADVFNPAGLRRRTYRTPTFLNRQVSSESSPRMATDLAMNDETSFFGGILHVVSGIPNTA